MQRKMIVGCQIVMTHIKKDETPPFAMVWMDLEGIVLSETSQARKISTVCSHSNVESKNIDHIGVESRMVVPRGVWGGWSMGRMLHLDRSKEFWLYDTAG
jgi:hypothetical protein